MPDSCQSRPSSSLEYVFLLAKGSDYFFDMDAVRQVSAGWPDGGGGGACFGRSSDPDGAAEAGAQQRRYKRPRYPSRAFRNTDLWFQSISSPHGMVGLGDEIVGLDMGKPGKQKHNVRHFATWSPKLVTPLILAGTSAAGCCSQCGAPWWRVVNRVNAVKREGDSGLSRDRSYRWSRNGVDSTLDSGIAQRETVGWQKMCGCKTEEVSPCIVLDPFVGSGTTVAVALQLGRAGIGIDLSEDYLRANAIPRIEAVLSGRDPRTVGQAEKVQANTPPAPRKLRG